MKLKSRFVALWVGVSDGPDHALDRETVIDAAQSRSQQCEAMCGYTVNLRTSGDESKKRCRTCARTVAARETLPDINERLADVSRPRGGLAIRLFGRSHDARHHAG